MKIAELVKVWRWKSELTVRQAASEMGISAATLNRIERGMPMSDKHLALLIRWLLT